MAGLAEMLDNYLAMLRWRVGGSLEGEPQPLAYQDEMMRQGILRAMGLDPQSGKLVGLPEFGMGGMNAGLFGIIEDIPAPIWNRGALSVPVGVNPTPSEIRQLTRAADDGILRVLEPKNPEGMWYLWPFDQAMHKDVLTHYGIDPKAYHQGVVE